MPVKPTTADPVRLIAFYLPQYHPIPENDKWWGEGFTEWTNVRKALPRFPGQHQPHVPGQLGYYDLRDPEIRAAQAALAREYGIHGFCYYHYWFNGRRLLERPFNEVLASGKPDFPFCVCWANENWTRAWDGADREILMAQEYCDEDSLAFIKSLLPAFRDDRYIRVNGRPLLLVYRTGLLPDPGRAAEIWRETVRRAGLEDLYLVRVESRMDGTEPAPEEIGFDAAVEFAPNWTRLGERILNLAETGGQDHLIDPDVSVYDYEQIIAEMLLKPAPAYKLFRGIFPTWDNTPRRKKGPLAIVNSTPEKYAFWLSRLLRQTLESHAGEERLVFINAWNEWGEGCHLEPDQEHGLGYLETTRKALAMAQLYTDPGVADGREVADRLLPCFKETSDLLLQTYARFQRLKVENIQLTRRVNDILNSKNDILNSKSWKLTEPLRRLFKSKS
jgi:Glycosyltransferase WbsX